MIFKIKKRTLCICIIIVLGYFFYKLTNYEHFANLKTNEPKVKLIYDDKTSKFSDIKVAHVDKHGKCLFIDNELQLSEKDEHIYHEMIVHFPSQYVDKMEKIIIIGGGDLMTLREVMKYPNIKEVYILELDPAVVETCKKAFKVNTFDKDKRVKYLFGDANETIDTLQHKKGEFDLCIVDTTEDGSNNLSVDKPSFFNKCKELLHYKGILVKNGDFMNELSPLFDGNLVYGAHIPSFDSIYPFHLSSKNNNRIINKNISLTKWNILNIETKHYSIGDHFDYIIYNFASYIK